jgi:hypothetical protein
VTAEGGRGNAVYPNQRVDGCVVVRAQAYLAGCKTGLLQFLGVFLVCILMLQGCGVRHSRSAAGAPALLQHMMTATPLCYSVTAGSCCARWQHQTARNSYAISGVLGFCSCQPPAEHVTLGLPMQQLLLVGRSMPSAAPPNIILSWFHQHAGGGAGR